MNGDTNSVHDEQDETNIDQSFKKQRYVKHGSTSKYLTYLELNALLMRRIEQVNTINGLYSKIDSKIIEKLGINAGLRILLLAEIADNSIDYPLYIVRGAGAGARKLRIHKDLILLSSVIDYHVLSNDTGRVIYDNVSETLSSPVLANANADSLTRDIAIRQDILNAMHY